MDDLSAARTPYEFESSKLQTLMLLEFATSVVGAIRDFFRSRANLVAENALLRQQVIVLGRSAPRPRLQRRDRVVMAGLTKLVPSAIDAVRIVKPETVIHWHKSLARLIWRFRSRGPLGRPPIGDETRELIRRMWRDNAFWGENRIAAELAKLGHRVSPRTVARYRPANSPRGRGQKWSTFVRNHLLQTWACDWFTITTLTFKTVYAFVILDLSRREVVRVGVTTQPSGLFASQSFVEAVADRDQLAPRFLVRDRGLDLRRWLPPSHQGMRHPVFADASAVASGECVL